MSTARRAVPLARAILLRGTGFGIAWWVLAEGVHYNIWLALLAIAAAVVASIAVSPPRRGRRVFLAGALRFAGYFVVRSVLAGVDVARRALHPALPVQPGWIRHRTALPAGIPRGAFMAVLSLLPGTLAAGESGDEIRVHVLDVREPVHEEIAELERRVAAIFRD